MYTPSNEIGPLGSGTMFIPWVFFSYKAHYSIVLEFKKHSTMVGHGVDDKIGVLNCSGIDCAYRLLVNIEISLPFSESRQN